MPGRVKVPRKKGRLSMGKKRLKQINFKCEDDLFNDLAYIARALRVDLSNLARMLISESLKASLERAEEILPRATYDALRQAEEDKS